MKKSQIRQLVKETIMDMFEAEISKGGFTLQDFSKVHGGEAGQRKQDKGLFDLQKKVEFTKIIALTVSWYYYQAL